jgi:predicted MFS family arabinose efflux permease
VRHLSRHDHGGVAIVNAKLPRHVSFWLLAVLLGVFLFAATAPSPLYGIYQMRFGFSTITLTAIYAVYAFGALGALLFTGRLPDHLGRRNVVIGALALQIAGMAAFIAADSVKFLYVGRVLQGAATGIATGAISAWLLDLQPPENARLGSLVGGAALIIGLGAGALGTGVLVEYGPSPLRLVYSLLAALYAMSLGLVLLIPDIAQRRPGAFRSMRPQVGVPRQARPTFAALIPSFIATWALGGFYASLGPSLAISLLQTDSRLPGGFVIAALLWAGALASALAREAEPRALVTRGSLVLVAGVAITLVGVAFDSAAGLFAGSVIAGLGFGPAFSGVFRSIAPLAEPERRGALLAAMYIVLYLSFSLPTIAAGIALTRYPLRETTYVYGLAVMGLAVMTSVALSRRSAASTVGT